MAKLKLTRTINKAYEEIIERDPKTSITRSAIRKAVINGDIPSRNVGRTYLINLEDVYGYFTGTECEIEGSADHDNRK